MVADRRPRLGLPAFVALALLVGCGSVERASHVGRRCDGTPNERAVHLPILYYFALSAGELDPTFPPPSGNRGVSEEVVRAIGRYPADSMLEIKGHTGQDCAQELDHPELSVQRAESVADELVRLGFPRARIIVMGVGSREGNTCCQGWGCDDGVIDGNRIVDLTVRWCEDAPLAEDR